MIDVNSLLFDLEKKIDFFTSITTLLFDQFPFLMNVVDTNGNILAINKSYLEFIDAKKEDVIGKNISDIESSSRMNLIVNTGISELSQPHKFIDGREVIVHRFPIYVDNKIIAGISILELEDINALHNIKIRNSLINSLKNINSDIMINKKYEVKYDFNSIYTNSIIGLQCLEKAKKYASTDFEVLITGETGVGKELFAHSIHSSSSRKNKPFVRLNCAAIPETLIESELFGYEKGSFTGANNNGHIGKFQLANGGTLFLDEIGEMPLNAQSKLLRVLQEKEIEKVGGNKIISIDIRVIAATNCNLEEEVKKGNFREDLYYRLNVLNLYIPSLRERKDDIPLLIEHLTTCIYQKYGIYKKFSKDAIRVLEEYDWPGNIRELKNIIKRIVVNCNYNTVETDSIPNHIIEQAYNNSLKHYYDYDLNDSKPLKHILENVESKIIQDTLKLCGGNKSKAASLLGIPRMTLYRKLNK